VWHSPYSDKPWAGSVCQREAFEFVCKFKSSFIIHPMKSLWRSLNAKYWWSEIGALHHNNFFLSHMPMHCTSFTDHNKPAVLEAMGTSCDNTLCWGVASDPAYSSTKNKPADHKKDCTHDNAQWNVVLNPVPEYIVKKPSRWIKLSKHNPSVQQH